MTDDPAAREAALTAIAKRGVDGSLHHATTRRALIDRLRDQADVIERELDADRILSRLLTAA